MAFVEPGYSLVAALFPELYEKLFSDRRSGSDYRLSNAERQMKVEDLLAVAVLADGRVGDREWAALGRVGDPDVVATWRRRAIDLTDRDELRRTVRLLAAPLSRREREAALRLVQQLVRSGAGLASPSPGYRNGASGGEELLELYRQELEVG